jgi:hypothetical protein
VLLLVFQAAYAQEGKEDSTSINDVANVPIANPSLIDPSLIDPPLINPSLTNVSLINGSIDPIDLQGIWSFRLDDAEQVTSVLHQQGELIIGSAKSEGEHPWNAVLQGSISGGSLDLTLNYLMNKSLVSLQLAGVVENENSMGSFVRVNDLGSFERGHFNGIKINTDLSTYTPAQLLSDVEKANASKPDAESAPEAKAKPVVVGNPLYQDVPSKIGSVPMSIGVGFVGDGTAGAGGMGLG